MTPPKLKHSLAFALTLLCLSTAHAQYEYRIPIPGLVAPPTAQPCAGSTTTVTQQSDFTMTAPTGCSHATVAMWGAGGGGYSGNGGGGGYTGATLTVPSGATVLVRVGQGGAYSSVCEFGSSQCNSGTSYYGGYGGGGSFVYVNGTLELAAGGGGGGGGTGSQYGGTAGGAGGGTSGLTGTDINYSGWGKGGLGGTQTAGGAAGTPSPSNGFEPGTAGSYLLGGDSVYTSGTNYGGGGASGIGWSGNGAGGGGGGGYYGGGAGTSGGYYTGGAGGGGGSGYAASGITAALTAGSGTTPGNASASGRGTAGNGGSGSAGQNGLVVITWSQ